MTVIANEVHNAVVKEQAAAERVHGLHHSDAEKYAVILEELEEAEEALRDARERLDAMWLCVRGDAHKGAEQMAEYIADQAELAAIECIQLAAVARKEVRL